MCCRETQVKIFRAAPILFSFQLPVCNARPIDIYIYNMHSYAGTTTLNLYRNLYYAKTKWLLFETKDNFQKCNSTIKTLLALKTAAKDIWSILGRTKSSF